jgi:DnaJ-domain-containing protein 1
MFAIFNKIFGKRADPGPRDDRLDPDQAAEAEDKSSVRISDPALPPPPYFTHLEQLRLAVSKRDYAAAAAAARASLPLLRAWLTDPRGEGNRLDIRIPALSQGGTMMAFVGDADGLSALTALVHEFNELKPYREAADQHIADLALFDRIRTRVRAEPGILQPAVVAKLGLSDARRVSRLFAYLAKAGEITRAKSGSTYALYPSDQELPAAVAATIYTEPPKPGSHRAEASATAPRALDVKKIDIIRLPPSPRAWEHWIELPNTEEAFADPKGAWHQIIIETIPKELRPDPAFRTHYSTSGGTLSIDNLAKSAVSLGGPGAVMFSDAGGRSQATAQLRRDAYPIAVQPEGCGFAALSKSRVLSIYDQRLDIDFETDLARAPEIAAVAERLGWSHEEASRAIRCIALSPIRDRYLFTCVDEAWCINRAGNREWGLRTPQRDPAPHTVRISFGTKSEVEEALQVLGLQLPVTSAEIQQRYRALARQYHPDLQSGSVERMKAINVAADRLTGLSPEELDGSSSDAGTTEVVVTLIHGPERDWIYAAAFSGDGETALIGTFAGLVVRVAKDGTPVAIYDVGSAPVRIVETSRFLYVMTMTRLYVLAGEQLMGLEDCSPKSDLIVGHGLVLLVEDKGIRVFTEDGRAIGLALTAAPIRRAYVDTGDVVVETRTHRARFRGAHRRT